MARDPWLLYGAYGYTGKLIAEEAVRRGHHPILAGRSRSRLEPLAQRLGLDWIVVDLEDSAALANATASVDLVFHAAGPFIHTSAPMLRACLATNTNYVDITGELPVFAHTFAQDEVARQRGVALLSGVGFDVVPTDCLAKYVAEQLPDAVRLDIAIASLSHASAGTIKTMLEFIPNDGKVRRDGKLVTFPFGAGARRVRFSDRERAVLPIPWGDLQTAHRTTGIPNITTYIAYPDPAIRMIRWSAPLLQWLLSHYPMRRIAQAWAAQWVRGPNAALREHGRSYIWACVSDAQGTTVQAWLQTPEAYHFTALAGVHCVERLLQQRPVGALTPALAFGADFVLEIEGTNRKDEL
jgi:short subunit dehydrogenase-like uncharacterized protein